MTSDSTRPLFLPFQAETELELLQLILPVTNRAYPWDPSEIEANAYFAELEQEVVATEWMAEEIAIQGQALSVHFEHIWSTVLSTAQASSQSLIDELKQRFASRVPQQLLEGIVHRTRQALATNLSLADQLVMCVQELLPNWGEDDLQVLARPFAYAMRGQETETLESVLKSVNSTSWTELSSVEQARLSLAIARYAISQMPQESTDR